MIADKHDIEKAVLELRSLKKQGLSNPDLWDYYQSLNVSLQESPEVISRLLSFAPEFFEELKPSLQEDKNLICFLVKKDENVFDKISQKFQKDMSVINETLHSNSPNALKIVLDKNPLLLIDKSFLLSAVKINGFFLKSMPDMYRDDWDITHEAIKENMHAIIHASEKFLETPEELVAIDFIKYLDVLTRYGINKEHMPKHRINSIEKIKRQLELNENKDFYTFTEDYLLKNWNTYCQKGYQQQIYIQQFAIQLNQTISYMMPSWKEDSIQKLLDQTQRIEIVDIKNTLSVVFQKELQRRTIQGVNKNKEKMDVKKSKSRKVF
jgi:hypothetical protein